MTAKPGSTSLGGERRYWKDCYLAKIAGIFKVKRGVAQKVLQRTFETPRGVQPRDVLRLLCFYF